MRGEDDAVANGAMAGNAHLAGKNHVVADDGGAGQAGLRADQRIVADARAVAYLNEIIDFGAVANLGRAYGSAVDGGVRLHVHTAANANGAGLRDLLPLASVVL